MIEVITNLMSTPLPSKTKQRKLCFVPDKQLSRYVYTALNYAVFEGKLNQTTPISHRSMYSNWGNFSGYIVKEHRLSKIRILPKYFCVQWFVTILAHEMIHAYQWEILRSDVKLVDHGESFLALRPAFRQFGIPVTEHHNVVEWFKTQDILSVESE